MAKDTKDAIEKAEKKARKEKKRLEAEAAAASAPGTVAADQTQDVEMSDAPALQKVCIALVARYLCS